MTNAPPDPARHHPLEFPLGASGPAVNQPAAWPSPELWPSGSGHDPEANEPRTGRRRRRPGALIAVVVAFLLSLNAGAGLSWAAAHRDAAEANDDLVRVRVQLARTSDLAHACARVAERAQGINQMWDKIVAGQAQWQGTDPGSAARRRVESRLTQQYASLDTRIQDAKALAESCRGGDLV